MRQINLGGKVVNDDSDCYVIAEIGHNHQGSVETARGMFRAAKDCGADAVKLQTRNNKELFTKEGYDSPYVNENSYGATYGEHREYLEFTPTEYRELMSYANWVGITLFSTPFDFSSADYLNELGMPFFKTASGDLNNIPFLEHIARFGKPMIISTGGAEIGDVFRAIEAVYPINKDICILQCTACYPADFCDLNLSVIGTYRELFPNLVVGLSSHDNGIAMPLVAYMCGARVIEKHFTLNHTWKGTDHAFSLEPTGFKKMVRDLRRAKEALGDGKKKVYSGEVKPIEKMSKKIVAARDLKIGYTLKKEDMALKSPGDGAPPYLVEKFVGSMLMTAVKKDEKITWMNITG
jgi:N-acetylneuraminate synthase/sialic acid synthase